MEKTKHRGIEKMARRTFRVRVRGKDPRTGKLKEVDRVLVDVDLAEARRLREQWHADITTGAVEEKTKRTTVRAFARSWSESRAPRLKWSVVERYGDALDNHILPAFGDLYFDTLTKQDIEAWVVELAKKYRPETVNGRLRVLKTLCRDAAADLGITDPSVRVRPLPTRDVADRRQALTADELRELLEVVCTTDPEQYPLLLTFALTGMRWGEATALKWSDVDEGEAVIRVVRSHYRGRISTTKTGRSRTSPLAPELSEVLREHRQRMVAAQHPALGEGWVFAVRSAKEPEKAALPAPSTWAKCLPRWLEAAKITKHITPHAFRRTNVDLLRQAKVDAVVARSLVGHATEGMRDRYSTVATEEQREAMSRVVGLVGVGGR
jgi:integrase